MFKTHLGVSKITTEVQKCHWGGGHYGVHDVTIGVCDDATFIFKGLYGVHAIHYWMF